MSKTHKLESPIIVGFDGCCLSMLYCCTVNCNLIDCILQDLSQYKYNKMITKSLNILNKIYSSKMNMFLLSSKAQVQVTV